MNESVKCQRACASCSYLIASITEICLHYSKCNEMCVIGCLVLAACSHTLHNSIKHVFVRFDAHEKVLIEEDLQLNQKFFV